MKHAVLLVGLLASTAACSSSSSGDTSSSGGAPPAAGTGDGLTAGGASGGTASGGASTGGASTGGTSPTGGAAPTGGVSGGSGTTGGTATSGGSSAGGSPAQGGTQPSGGAGRAAAGSGGDVSAMGGGEAGGAGAGGPAGGTSGAGGGAAGAAGSSSPSCVGKAWPTADPTNPGPFQVTTDKNVGPLAGYLPDPIYGDQQQRFNVYRPSNLDSSGYCHPILVWANGHGDNPEQHPPECVVDSATNRWCGTYPVLINQLASHGFVVVASLSTTTSRGDPLPTIVGLNWLLEQAEDPTSPYYHHLDTARIGALGHSEGGLSTCKAAADPRITTIATVSGSATPTGLQGPALFICGGQDTVVSCDSVATTYSSVTDQPAMLMDNLSADHGGWLYQNGTKGPDIFALTAWFRVQLMDDTANRAYFYGAGCKLCTDNRVTVQRNSLMDQ
jgi:hypothetical protein